MSAGNQNDQRTHTLDRAATGGVHRAELDLGRPEDRLFFLESIEDVYADAMLYRGIAEDEQYRSLGYEDVAGKEVFDTLYLILQEIQEKIMTYQDDSSTGRMPDIPHATVQYMQRQYDDMLLLRDFIRSTYRGKEGDRRIHVEDKEDKKKEGSNQPVRTVSGLGNVISHNTPRNTKTKSDPVDRSYAEIEDMLRSATQRLEVTRARVLNRLSATTRTSAVEVAVATLDAGAEQLANLIDRVASAKHEVRSVAVLRETYNTYRKVAAGILSQAETLEVDLTRQAEATPIKAEQQPVARTQIVAVAPKVSRASLEPPHSVQHASGTIPSEAEVTALVKFVLDDPFFTQSEKSRMTALCESFHRAVALGHSSDAISESFQKLTASVQMMRSKPEVEVLRERAGRILQRVTAGLPYDSEVLRTARRLEHVFRQMASDPEESDVRIRAAYAELEYYARKHEHEWLTICGCHVPGPGPSGLAAARRLRETLLIERDQNRALVYDPRKQMMVDKLVRKLSTIPPSGLSADADLPTLTELIRSIDTPYRQGELCTVSEGAGELEVSPEETAESFDQATRTEPVHKVMKVSTEDVEEKLEIRVATKAGQRLTEAREQQPTLAEAQLLSEEPRSQLKQVIAKAERSDPINRVAPQGLPHLPPVRPSLEKSSLTALYLSDQKYQAFIAEHYSSQAAYERMLDVTVSQFESKTTDVFEKWLQEEYASPFPFLEELTLGEINDLASEPRVRETLLAQNIKYETFLLWLDLIPEMQAVVGEDPNMKFGELFARWMIETEMHYAAEQATSIQ